MSVVLGGGGDHEADVVVAQDLGGEDLEDVADDPEEEEAAQTAPEQSVQLLAKRGKKFVVLGPVGWWLYVKRFDSDETGYIPSTHVAPITDDLSCEE